MCSPSIPITPAPGRTRQSFWNYKGGEDLVRIRCYPPAETEARSKIAREQNGSVWESNPLGAFSKPHTGFEDLTAVKAAGNWLETGEFPASFGLETRLKP